MKEKVGEVKDRGKEKEVRIKYKTEHEKMKEQIGKNTILRRSVA